MKWQVPVHTFMYRYSVQARHLYINYCRLPVCVQFDWFGTDSKSTAKQDLKLKVFMLSALFPDYLALYQAHFMIFFQTPQCQHVLERHLECTVLYSVHLYMSSKGFYNTLSHFYETWLKCTSLYSEYIIKNPMIRDQTRFKTILYPHTVKSEKYEFCNIVTES